MRLSCSLAMLLLIASCSLNSPSPTTQLRVEIVDRISQPTLTGGRAYFFEIRWVDSSGASCSTRIGVSYSEWVRFRDTAEVCMHPSLSGVSLDPCR